MADDPVREGTAEARPSSHRLPPPRRRLATEGHVRGIAIGSAACFVVSAIHVARTPIAAFDRAVLLTLLGTGLVACVLLFRLRPFGRMLYVLVGIFLALFGFHAGVLMTIAVLVALFDRHGMTVFSRRYDEAIAAKPDLRAQVWSSGYLWAFLVFAAVLAAAIFFPRSSFVVS